MYLKRLELQGFKSFANKTVLEFKKGITAVIGPNGSGKSNISDAIRWVLGEQSMKSLRGTKSEDIIFSGTQSRKSLGYAEVSMIIDNSDDSLPIEFTEVTVTRRLYRTGESGYFINKTPCKLKDIYELFMDTGIGKDGYSIIGQGKIDEILSNKSEDRRHIFEEAAGIVKYRTRRQESEKKLEQTKVNLIRINDILTEIESNIEPLRVQSEKAKRFLELKEELKKIEVGLYVYRIDSLKEKLEELKNNKEIFDTQKIDEEAKLNKMQELKEELKSQVDSISEQLDKLQTLGFESQNSIEKINSNINVSNEKIANNIENKNRLESEITISTQNISEMEDDKKNREIKKENLLKNKEKFSKELENKEQELAKLTEKLGDKELEIEEKKKKIEKLTEDKYEKQNLITEKDTNCKNDENRKSQIDKELWKTISELDEKRDSRNELNKKLIVLETKRNEDKSKLEKIQKEKQVIDEKTVEYEDKIANLIDEKRMKTSKYNFLVETEKEKEGYVRSVKELLIACESNVSLKRGIHGVLANLIQTEDKYSTAIEMALGPALQNIVTENEHDAKKMIEYLRNNNLGRASFLPIATIQGNKVNKYSKVDGVVGIASELVKYERKYEGIINNLLGRTVITEDIESAINLAKANKYAFRIVTLEGDIINASGAMTGGSTAKKTFNLLGRTAEIKKLAKDIENIDKKLEKIVMEKESFLKQNEDIINTITMLTEELQKSEVSFAAQNEKVKAADDEISKIENSKTKLENEKVSLDEEIKIINEDKVLINTEIEKMTLEIEELTKVVNSFAEDNKENQKYIDDLNFDITNLKISVSSFDESNSSIEEMMARIDEDIQNEKKEIENKKKEILEINNKNKELTETIEEFKKAIDKINEEVKNSSGKIEELKKSRNEKNTKLNDYEKDISSQFEVIQNIKEQLIKVDLKLTNLDQDIAEKINELWEEYEITPNNAKDYPRPENVQETQKNVNKIHEEIKELGSVNVDAIEEYKKTKERYETMNEQRLDLENTMAKLRDIIQEMTQNMKKQFIDKFKLINKNFNEVFKELFGGGKAELVLEDEDNILECGIDIRVQPTGKNLQNMMLLSGGERALTAIALLFAILQINPAPFCILDEIEAALDDVNVYRYAEFLKKFSTKTQFLIITHRKGTMEAANAVYGVTMEESGISKLLSISLADAKG